MPDLDQELVERVTRWCAEAGRTTMAAEIRRALEGLSWDELLAARALLADPPPARPLGPFALADLARGMPAQTAADRERDGQYPSVADDGSAPAAPVASDAGASAPSPRARKAGKRAPSASVVIRRARDAAPPAPPPSPVVPLVDELFLPEGRAVLERLVRRLGARRHAVVAALAEGWRSPDGRAVDDALLARLLDQHGLARAFARREHDELLHALRASGGLRSAAAARLGLDRDALDAALARSGGAAEAEQIREARRAEVRARATLAERVRLLLGDPARLEDLGILAEVEEDLRRRLPEHVRAVGAAGGPILLALARSLSASPVEVKALLERLGVAAEGGPSGHAATPGAPPARARSRSASGPTGAMGGMRPPRRPGVDRGGRAGPSRTERRPPSGESGTFGPGRGRGAGRPGAFAGTGERRGRGPSGSRPGRPGERPDRGPAISRPGGSGERAGRGSTASRPGRPGERPGRAPTTSRPGGPRTWAGRPQAPARPGGPGERRSPRTSPGDGRPGRPGSRPPTRPGGPRGKPPPGGRRDR